MHYTASYAINVNICTSPRARTLNTDIIALRQLADHTKSPYHRVHHPAETTTSYLKPKHRPSHRQKPTTHLVLPRKQQRSPASQHRACPNSLAAGTILIDIDGTTIPAASNRSERSAGLSNGGHRFHPLTSWSDNTGEPSALMLRPGNVGSNTAQGLTHILTQTFESLPARHPARHRRSVVVRTDNADGCREFTSRLAECNTHSCRVEY